MNNKLVEELRGLIRHPKEPVDISGVDGITCAYLNGQKAMYDMFHDEINAILSRHAKVEEPLAVLADRKGYVITRIDGKSDGDYRWAIGIRFQDEEGIEGNWKGFEAPTYAAAEAKARAYLEGLDDTGKGGGR
jgi:hypothetical protein